MTELDKRQLLEAVRTASRAWQASFNRGDAAGCAAAYEDEAVMTASPFGTFRGRAEIQAFWQQIIDQGYSDVTYIDPRLEPVGDDHVLLSSAWRMNKAHGVITRELWVIQEDGGAKLREDAFEVQG